ncbi:MAG: ChaN family lipoprotein [Oligoflexia bacterium]|nr:ChaN family lipoprotein [Oligoflexia bacterium]
MRFKSQIFNLHEKIFESTAKRAQELFGESSKDLQSYLKEQKKMGTREFEIIPESEIFQSIDDSNIIFVADFHTFDRNVRNLHRILQHLIEKESEFVLAIEMVSFNNQKYIDSFLMNHLTELEFLESIDYNRSWRFPWAHYRIIFELAKSHSHHFKIIGLNSHGSLKERDIFAANIIYNNLITNPQIKIVVFIGELHVLYNKLPFNVLQQHPKINITIIHQNIDQVYLKLKSRNLENTVIRFNNSNNHNNNHNNNFIEYSIQTSPPWIKYDSVIYWFENFTDDPDFNIHEYIIEKGFKIFGGSTIQNFQLILNEIQHSLKLDYFPTDKLSDFDLYDHTNLEYVQSLTEKIDHPKLQVLYAYLLDEGQGLKLYHQNKYYSVYYSVNRFAYLAGIHLFSLLIENNENNQSIGIYLEDKFIEKDRTKRFLAFFQMSMISYFCTKIINPHRKCDMYLDIINNLKLPNSKFSKRHKKYHLLSLSIINNNVDLNQLFKDHSLCAYYQVSQIVGHFFSELLFEKMCNIDYEFSIKFIKIILFTKVIDYEIFIYLKDLLLVDLTYKKTQKREF